MKSLHAQRSTNYMAMMLVFTALALSATLIAFPVSFAGVHGSAEVSSVSVQDKRTEIDALQVMMFVHRQGAMVAMIEEGQ